MAASMRLMQKQAFSFYSGLQSLQQTRQITSLKAAKPSTILTRCQRSHPLLTNTRQMVRQAERGQRRSLAPVDSVPAANGGRSFSSLIKPFAFTVTVSFGSFGAAIIWQYETLRTHFKNVRDNIDTSYKEQFYGKAGSFRHHINSFWNNLTPAKQIVAGIIAANIAVFSLWKVRSLQNVMLKYFSSSPFSGAPCLSLIGSAFSHYSLLHIGANMFVLWSFSAPITEMLGREQFVAFYLTAGVLSGFTSYIYKIARMSLVPSLGASGVIMAMLGAVCCQYPEARLSIAFVDMIVPHSFSADSAMKSLIAFDTLGILFGWRLFDHAAHLGGILFGIWYQKYGRDIVWKQYREPVMKFWHEMRGKP